MMMSLKQVLLVAVAIVRSVVAAPESDLVTSLPDFDDFSNISFKMYSGYLSVNLTGSGLKYTALDIHYEFYTCVNTDCPVAVWHQGGPGGSAIFGAWTEMGPFQLMTQGPVYNFENSWNNVANMLFLESPAGSFIAEDDRASGFSKCYVGSREKQVCQWSDTTQAVAYAYTLKAFYAAFPEYFSNDLYLVGESYAGMYIPNIATYMVNNPSIVGKNLTGIAVGNGCFGGSENEVICNGKDAEKNDIEIYHGKFLISTALYDEIQSKCYSTNTSSNLEVSATCAKLKLEARKAIGNYNIYNVYDTCNLDDSVTAKHTETLRASMGTETTYTSGYAWNCESDPDLDAYFTRDDVQKALHLDGSGSGFSYTQSGPASVLLYPTLLKHMRVLIYNGDADLCVPYLGNEQWTSSMVTKGIAQEESAWHPWYNKDATSYAPAGYVTTYTIPEKEYTSSSGADFAFLTIRLAGHMVGTCAYE